MSVIQLSLDKARHHKIGDRLHLLLNGGAVAIALVALATPAIAYRPFDGTDAAVADVKEVEIELQPLGGLKERLPDGTQTSLIAPQMIINYGFAERWEFVLQGLVNSPVAPVGEPSLQATGAFLKYIARPGVLQDKPGPSIAMEFGPLLPGINADNGVGFSWAGIVSQRWDWGTAHFNVETNLTRDQHGEAFLDLILEGPSKWTVRPVMEIFYDKVWNQTEEYSGLIGAIWKVRDNLSFDAAFRYAIRDGRPINEIRAGLTFAFKVDGEKKDKDKEGTSTRSGASFGNWNLATR
jgi:hypothetical protein